MCLGWIGTIIGAYIQRRRHKEVLGEIKEIKANPDHEPDSSLKIRVLTQEAYDRLEHYDSSTLYVITEFKSED